MGGLFGGPKASSISNPVAGQAPIANQDVNTALTQQQQFLQQLQAQGGLANQSNVFGQQQALSNQFGQIGQGQGPNPAQNMLNQATGQNVAGQAALMAGQRGAGSNVGLMARQIGQQGAGIQQQAIGQAATMQSQQQLAALQAQAQQQQAMQQVASNQIGTQQGAVNAYQQGALGQQSNVVGGTNAYNQAANQNQQNQTGLIGGLVNSVGGALPAIGSMISSAGTSGSAADLAELAAMGAHGGEVRGYDQGGYVPTGADQPGTIPYKVQHVFDSASPQPEVPVAQNGYGDINARIAARQAQRAQIAASSGGPKSQAGQVISGMWAGGNVKNMTSGGGVPGQAKVKGDSYKNDTVKAKLSPGEIVLPRTVAQHPDAPEMAKRFVQAIRAHKGVLRK